VALSLLKKSKIHQVKFMQKIKRLMNGIRFVLMAKAKMDVISVDID